MDNIEKLFQDWMDWSKKTFEKADERVSLDKALDEIKELQMEFQMHDGERSEPNEIIEYVDIIMCLLHSAARRGYAANEILGFFKMKFKINATRTWKLNPNNTYSHVK